VKQTFQQIAGLPNVLGAIDGSYIQIKAPKVFMNKLYDKKFNLIRDFVF